MAFRVAPDNGGEPSLAPAWISRDVAVPDPVAIAGEVVFTLGTGEDTTQIRGGFEKHTHIEQVQAPDVIADRVRAQSGHATLYAFDARNGRELWSSREAITGWTHFSGVAVGDGKVLLSTHDGAVYAFGLPEQQAAAPRITDYSEPESAATPSVATSSPAAPQCGQTTLLFRERCATCHDASGRGITAVHTPDFTDRDWQLSKPDAELEEAVRSGRPGGMPAFADTLTPPQIDQLVHCVVRGFAQLAR
jgi:mono/diheme cytochrome c family protein